MNKIGIALMAGVLVAGAAQFVPYGHDHSNPPVIQEAAWTNPATRALAVRACFDCHSNETRWPWYSNIAPVSWIVRRDVDEGRETLNFSQWNNPGKEAGEAAQVVRDGQMPPRTYTLAHPEARLSAAERDLLAAGLQAVTGSVNGKERETSER